MSRNKTIKPLTKKQKIDRLISGAILAFQLITSCILVGLILNLNMLTMKYTIPIVIVVVLFFALVLASQLIKKRNSKRKLFGRIVSLVLSCLMIFASTYVLRTSHAINAISGLITRHNPFWFMLRLIAKPMRSRCTGWYLCHQ